MKNTNYQDAYARAVGLVVGGHPCRRGWLGLAHLSHLFIPPSSHRIGHTVITTGKRCAGYLEGAMDS